MWQCTAPLDTQWVVWCGGRRTTVELVLGPQFMGLDSGCERVGRRVVELYSAGAAALYADDSCI